MSLGAYRWAWASGSGGHAKLVLLALVADADDAGLCSPSVGRLAKLCGLSDRTVQRSLIELGRAGFLVRTARSGVVPRYQLTLHGLSNPRQVDTPSPVSLSGDPRQGVGGPPSRSRGSRERRMTGPERDFETFWQAYPRKVGKDAARRAYLRAMERGALPLVMLAAIGAQRWNDDPRYIPHASTWLNGGRWQDDPGAAAPPVGPGPAPRPPPNSDQERRDRFGGTDLLEEDDHE